MSNLCVMAFRSSGSLRRRGPSCTGAAAVAALSFDVFSGCVRFEPSR
jgi:hypothetical protein